MMHTLIRLIANTLVHSILGLSPSNVTLTYGTLSIVKSSMRGRGGRRRPR
jgi:hypothetical protein